MGLSAVPANTEPATFESATFSASSLRTPPLRSATSAHLPASLKSTTGKVILAVSPTQRYSVLLKTSRTSETSLISSTCGLAFCSYCTSSNSPPLRPAEFGPPASTSTSDSRSGEPSVNLVSVYLASVSGDSQSQSQPIRLKLRDS